MLLIGDEMAVLRKEKKSNFTVIDNAIFKDRKVSFKAKGLLCQMLSLPDGWEYSVKGLATLASDKYSAITSGLKELEEAGYFRREQLYDKGKFAGYEYIISETPVMKNSDLTFSENPISENTISENPTQLNTKESITNESKTKVIDIRHMIPPTIEMVEDYINEHGYNVNAHSFMDFYESKGWLVGKTKMRDWQAAVRTWSRNEYGAKNNKSSGNPFLDMLQEGDF